MPSVEKKVWGDDPADLWSFGEVVSLPACYKFVQRGNAALTREIKAHCEIVYVAMERTRKFNRVRGLWAPENVIAEAQKVVAASAERREAQREKARVARADRHEEALDELDEALGAMFPSMPLQDAELIVDHAFEVGSGRVGRTTKLPLEKQLRWATRAYIRHNYTAYDELLANGISRDDARFFVEKQVDEKLDAWRQPRPARVRPAGSPQK